MYALAKELGNDVASETLVERFEPLFGETRVRAITTTEEAFAINGGRVIAAKATGLVVAKRWKASRGACAECVRLDGREVALDLDFITAVPHPPLHPHCECSWTEVYA